MTRIPMRPLALLGLLFLNPIGSPTVMAQEPVSLSHWTGVASPTSSSGPGESLFLLKAQARWSSEARRSPRRYALQMTLPDGRSLRRSLLPGEGPGTRVLTIPVPVASVQNRRPEAVRVSAALVDPSTGAFLSNVLQAGIDQFPTPEPPGSRDSGGPSSWGRPINATAEGAAPLPRSGPDGWRFIRVAPSGELPGFFIAATEASNRQVALRLPGYDPNAGRSDEFLLDAPDQPALNLTAEQAEAYLDALSQADPSGLHYRLPTQSEWEVASRAGRSSGFWWGDAPLEPEGANFLGPEPGEELDTTAPVGPHSRGYSPNPWSLLHTFGNVAEWATIDNRANVFVRMGGHFRSEPTETLDPPIVDDPTGIGPDPYVGLRACFDLDAESGARLIEAHLSEDSAFAGVNVQFDPDRALATLTGTVDVPADRRRASEALRPLWFLAAVVDQLETPKGRPGDFAKIVGPAGPARRVSVLGRGFLEVPVSTRWYGPMPVVGSSWWLNVYGPNGGHWAHRIDPQEPGRPTITATIPIRLIGPDHTPRIALSLGSPAVSPADSNLVSLVTPLSLRSGENP